MEIASATNVESDAGFTFTRKKEKKTKESKRKKTAAPSRVAAQSNAAHKRQRVVDVPSFASTSSSSTSNNTHQESLVPKYPTVKPQPSSVRDVPRDDPATALTELVQNLVECEEKSVKRTFVGMNSYISEWASACCEEFLASVEDNMNEKRQEHWTVEPKQLVNPENVRLEKQRDQLEHLLSRLSIEVEAWKSHSNEEWSPSMDTSAVEMEDAKEAAAYEENAENNTKVPFERMSAQIRKMAVQVEHIQHALEQSKRTVATAETKRMQLSAQVHVAGKYSKKSTKSLIRGFLG